MVFDPEEYESAKKRYMHALLDAVGEAEKSNVSVTVWKGTTFSANWAPDRNECVSASGSQ
jgi:hypothetical protein